MLVRIVSVGYVETFPFRRIRSGLKSKQKKKKARIKKNLKKKNCDHVIIMSGV